MLCSRACEDKYSNESAVVCSEMERLETENNRLIQETKEKDLALARLKRNSALLENEVEDREHKLDEDLRRQATTIKNLTQKINENAAKLYQRDAELAENSQKLKIGKQQSLQLIKQTELLTSSNRTLKLELAEKDEIIAQLNDKLKLLEPYPLRTGENDMNVVSQMPCEVPFNMIALVDAAIGRALAPIYEKINLLTKDLAPSLASGPNAALGGEVVKLGCESEGDRRSPTAPTPERAGLTQEHEPEVSRSSTAKRNQKTGPQAGDGADSGRGEVVVDQSLTYSEVVNNKDKNEKQAGHEIIVTNIGNKKTTHPEITKEITIENDWKVVTRGKGRKSGSLNRPAPSKGTNNVKTTLNIAAPEKKTSPLEWIFLSGLSPDTSEEDILHFMQSQNLENGCKCFKMKTKTDSVRSSFKLGVPKEIKTEIMSTKLWPTGVLINHFMNLQHLTIQKK